MDKQTLAITPFKAPTGEQSGELGNSDQGQLRCVVVVPKRAAPGNPWSWRGVYWNHQPQAEVELLKRGFHIAYISVDPKPGSLTGLTMNELMDQLGMSRAALAEWDAWYAYLTGRYGLSKKPAFIGMSRGGIFEFSWGTANPDQVPATMPTIQGWNAKLFSGWKTWRWPMCRFFKSAAPSIRCSASILPPSRPSISSSADASR